LPFKCNLQRYTVAAVDQLTKVEAGILAISKRIATLRGVAEPYASIVGKGLELELPRLDAVRSVLLASRVEMIARVEALAGKATAARTAAEQGACAAAVTYVTNSTSTAGSAGAVPPAAADGVLRLEYRVPFTVSPVKALSASAQARAREAAAAAGVSMDNGERSILRVASEEPELRSFVGGSNRIVGGVTLHMSRKEPQMGDACGGKWAKLRAPCFPGWGSAG
jgi:hypothetical protein